jgi:hypothetical protein
MIHARMQAKGVEVCVLCSAVCRTRPRFLGVLVQTNQQHTRVSNDIFCSLINSELNGVVVLND